MDSEFCSGELVGKNMVSRSDVDAIARRRLSSGSAEEIGDIENLLGGEKKSKGYSVAADWWEWVVSYHE